MRVAFFWYDFYTDKLIFEALKHSMEKDGHVVEMIPRNHFLAEMATSYDIVCTRGISESRPVMNACFEKGVNVIYCDKSYVNRGWNDAGAHYRFSVNSFHPLHYFQKDPHPSDRWEKLGIDRLPRQNGGKYIVYASIPQKSANWHGFNAIEYAEKVIQKIKSITDRPIVYRPRKVKEPPPPIPGTLYSYNRCTIREELKDAYALVTYASNAAADAILAGVPAFVLGPGIARPVANTDLNALDDPYFPPDEKRAQWCYDLAYCQWSIDEMREGLAWKELKDKISRPELKISYAEKDFA
ncbi:MAG: hypothetical protein HYZ87_01855 [Candidatus Omnitrophica bacterium]|nr:hypothetical protein [Candidatus Omnitrophota bacterium]